MADKRRAVEVTLDIEASPEQVWRALTEAEELMRWFPLNAQVTPGPGGSMLWSWRDAWRWMTRIDAWEPPRRLRLVDETDATYGADGKVIEGGRREPARLAVEFTLETHAGKTRLRLVHSGFGTDGDWDDEIESVGNGWQTELRSLRHYLQRHPGRDRQVGWAHLATDETPVSAWDRLLGREAFAFERASAAGQPYALTVAGGERFSGTVILSLPPHEFTGTVRELDDALLRLTTHRAAGRTGVMVWLATYLPGPERAQAFEGRFRELLGRLFAS